MRRASVHAPLVVAAALLVVAPSLVACGDTSYVVDGFRVEIDVTRGVPELSSCPKALAPCDPALPTVIDTGTAMTMIDPGLAEEDPVRQQTSDLDLRTRDGSVTRARFYGLRPLFSPMATLGVAGGAETTAKVVVGGDALSRLAMRLDPLAGELFFFPNIAGTRDLLGDACLSVIPSTPQGGGTFTYAGGEATYPATRMVVGTCLNPDLPTKTIRPRGAGADALLVVATGLPITVLSRSAYERARTATTPPAPAVDALPTGTLHLPGSRQSDGLTVHLGTLTRLAIVADETNLRGPCQELRASRVMALGGCTAGEDCFCVEDSDSRPCRGGASVEIRATIDVAIVEDTEPVLQGLRAELRPRVADVDGFLGMNALGRLVTDFDYPGARLIMRCSPTADAACKTRPRLPDQAKRDELVDCLTDSSTNPNPN